MKFFAKAKDGGKDSPVDAYFLFEIKGLCSVALLKFNKGGREDFHSHAFHAFTWFLKGSLVEEEVHLYSDELPFTTFKDYKRSFLPKLTLKSNLHRVKANEDSWCFTIRGSWDRTWKEYNKNNQEITTLTHGRKVLSKCQLGGVCE